MSERRPLKQREYDALKYFMGFVSTFNVTANTLMDRATFAGCDKQIKSIATQAQNVMTKIFRTVPTEKLKIIVKELKHISVAVRVAYASPINEDGCIVMYEKDYYDLVRKACDFECRFCDKCGKEINRCETRKLITNTLPYAVDTMKSGHCIFSGNDFDEAIEEYATSTDDHEDVGHCDGVACPDVDCSEDNA